LADQPAHLLHSRDLADLEGSWEMPLLRAKENEQAALRLNGLAALARLARFKRPPGALLDFGCGAGHFLGAARELGWETFGVEPLPGHAIYARARFGAEVVADTLREKSFRPYSFDLITAFQVFEHLPDPAGTLGRLAHLLKPGGALYVEVPNVATWSVRGLGPRHRHFVQDHLYFFSAATLARLLRQAGLRVAGTCYPARRMSVRHLVFDWGGRVLPSSLARLSARLVKRARLENAIISVNVGDIVAVIGVKP
jgi:SAM-dependent methyltransferase